MTIKLKLRNAINAIEDAARRLRNARNTSNDSDLTRALHELDEAFQAELVETMLWWFRYIPSPWQRLGKEIFNLRNQGYEPVAGLRRTVIGPDP